MIHSVIPLGLVVIGMALGLPWLLWPSFAVFVLFCLLQEHQRCFDSTAVGSRSITRACPSERASRMIRRP